MKNINDKKINKAIANKIIFFKTIFFIMISILFNICIFNFIYANIYSNNSIEIDVHTDKKSYEYNEDIGLVVDIKNKNRYGKLHYKILSIESGKNFRTTDTMNVYKDIESFSSDVDNFTMIDKNKVYDKNENSGHKAYEITEKGEKDAYYRDRKESIESEEYKKEGLYYDKSDRPSSDYESKTNLTVMVAIVVILVICGLFLLGVLYVKAGGFGIGRRFGRKHRGFLLVVGISAGLIVGILFNNVISGISNIDFINDNIIDVIYAMDFYEEGIHYTKQINSRCQYGYTPITFYVNVEYYFENDIPEITDKTKDTDGDGLFDYLEVLYLTDLNSRDTDYDGLSDYIEINITYTNPNEIDSDFNGIEDGDEDYDNDGLTNIEEITNGCDPSNTDTDYDGLSDYDEVNGVKSKDMSHTYITNPCEEDTDGDSLRDDVEITLGLDPTRSRTDGSTLDSERKIRQDFSMVPKSLSEKAAVPIGFYGEVKGDINENLTVEKANNNFFDKFTSIIGDPIRIDTTYDSFSGLKIAYDLSKFEDIKDRIEVCRYENGLLIPIENTFVSGNTLYADVYNGEYVLVDTMKFIQDMNIYIGR